MGSPRTALVSCAQTILSFAKVVWVLSVSTELSTAYKEPKHAKILWRKYTVIGKEVEVRKKKYKIERCT